MMKTLTTKKMINQAEDHFVMVVVHVPTAHFVCVVFGCLER